MWLFDVSMQHKVFSGYPRWADNYWVHTRVMRLFGDLDGKDDVRERASILYRIEPGIGTGRVLVQSNCRVEDSNIRSKKLEYMLEGMRPGQLVGLRVKLNPVRTVNRTENGVTKTRREPLNPESIVPWFTSAIQRALGDLVVDQVESDIELQRSVPIAVVTIDASATVVNTDALISLVGTGLGRAKAFGCGMLSIRPLPSPHL